MNYVNLYINFLKRFIKIKRPLKVVFDCSNGTAGLILKKLLKAKSYKLKADFINSEPDGNFPAHGPNPSKKGALSDLRFAISKHKVDLGVIFDADGDRAFFIDNRGRFINPDIIARLLIWHLKPKKVVIGVRTGWLIKKFQIPSTKLQINSKFKISISKTGHFFIKKLMKQKKADFGAERSGHYYFKNFFYAESGILAAIEVINAVSKLPYSLADFADLLPQYYRSSEISIRCQVSGVRIQKLLRRIEKKLKTKSLKLKARISHLDGLTIETKDYWFNIRPSNTEPLIRLNIEAENKKVLQREKKRLTALIKKM
ncbi:MAG: hypothetical protein V3T98_01880 [Candidatus Paceibacterota bacterium]